MPKLRDRRIICLDTETAGLDFYHLAKPYIVTIADENGPTYWEWDVDPLTRQPIIPKSDKQEIIERINDADEIVYQNAKFDIQALGVIGIDYLDKWYKKTHDTLFAAHLIASAEPHSLDVLALRYLRLDITPYEKVMEVACKEARGIAKREFPKWMLAKEGLAGMPSVGGGDTDEKPWKNDAWLPRALAKAKGYPTSHPWYEVTAEYANCDSQVTLAIWKIQKEILTERKLWNVYEERRKLIPVIVDMEREGVTFSSERLNELKTEFEEESARLERVCINLSDGKLESLPKSGTTKAMRELMFDVWKMPIVKRSEKTGEPSVDKNVLEVYENTLRPGSKPLAFIRALRTKRKRDTSISYMSSYVCFGCPTKFPTIQLLHPSLNPTGQKTLRWSSQKPNEQNIAKKMNDGAKGVRYCFGPAPGREWWSLDYQNIELRIPAYEADEPAMVELFEHPDREPYLGSYHLLVADLLWPKEFAECVKTGERFNKKYKSTLYQWTKNGDFATSYQAQDATADRAYHHSGALKKVKSKFANIDILNKTQNDLANSRGYVETVYDKVVGGSYPIQTPKGDWGKVSPTIPLSYHIQSTAMWCTAKAMVRVWNYFKTLVKPCRITLQVHDELVIDLPKGKTPKENLPIVLDVQRLMEQSGDDIDIPLKVEYSYHPETWEEEVKL